MSWLTIPNSVQPHSNLRLVPSKQHAVVVTCALGLMACGTPPNTVRTGGSG